MSYASSRLTWSVCLFVSLSFLVWVARLVSLCPFLPRLGGWGGGGGSICIFSYLRVRLQVRSAPFFVEQLFTGPHRGPAAALGAGTRRRARECLGGKRFLAQESDLQAPAPVGAVGRGTDLYDRRSWRVFSEFDAGGAQTGRGTER